MIAENPTRQSLRNKPRLQTKASVESSHVEIRQQNSQETILFKNPRSFGQDITNLGPNAQPPTKTSSRPALDQMNQNYPCKFQKPSMMVQETFQGRSEVDVYLGHIESYLLSVETSSQPTPDFLASQPQITSVMRQILINWLSQLRAKLRLKAETLFKAVSLIDLYLSIQAVSQSQFHLLGITCMYISCKYEQIYIQKPIHYMNACSSVFTVQDLFRMESMVLISLDFRIPPVTCLGMMQLKCEQLVLDKQVKSLSQILLQMSLLQSTMCQFRPSTLAQTSIYLSGKILGNISVSQSGLRSEIGNKSQFKSCLKEMFATYKTRDNMRKQILKKGIVNSHMDQQN